MNWREIANSWAKVLRIGVREDDSSHARRVKAMFAATLIASAIYAVLVFFAPNRSAIELILDGFALVLCLVSLAALQVTKSTKKTFGFVFCWVLPLLAGYYFLHGTRDGDMYFAMLLPVAAVAFFGPVRSIKYLVFCVVAVASTIAVDGLLPVVSHQIAVTQTNPDGLLFHSSDKTRFGALEALTFFGISIMLFALSHAGASALKDANTRVGDLLNSILPKPIAQKLAEGAQPASTLMVERYEETSVLFADLVGFTDLSQTMQPDELVNLLNDLFSRFDTITADHCVEKVKTIGDAYMAVCGLPERQSRHAEKIAAAGLEMMACIEQLNQDRSVKLGLRIGICSGPVVAGVIGRRRFAYDLWGETVNTASRMESLGSTGQILTSQSTYELLRKQFRFTSLGEVAVKGYGKLPVWRLLDEPKRA